MLKVTQILHLPYIPIHIHGLNVKGSCSDVPEKQDYRVAMYWCCRRVVLPICEEQSPQSQHTIRVLERNQLNIVIDPDWFSNRARTPLTGGCKPYSCSSLTNTSEIRMSTATKPTKISTLWFRPRKSLKSSNALIHRCGVLKSCGAYQVPKESRHLKRILYQAERWLNVLS